MANTAPVALPCPRSKSGSHDFVGTIDEDRIVPTRVVMYCARCGMVVSQRVPTLTTTSTDS